MTCCVVCGSVEKLTVDHIYPKCFGKVLVPGDLILPRDWEFIVDYFKLYGMTLKLKPRVSELPYSLKE